MSVEVCTSEYKWNCRVWSENEFLSIYQNCLFPVECDTCQRDNLMLMMMIPLTRGNEWKVPNFLLVDWFSLCNYLQLSPTTTTNYISIISCKHAFNARIDCDYLNAIILDDVLLDSRLSLSKYQSIFNGKLAHGNVRVSQTMFKMGKIKNNYFCSLWVRIAGKFATLGRVLSKSSKNLQWNLRF